MVPRSEVGAWEFPVPSSQVLSVGTPPGCGDDKTALCVGEPGFGDDWIDSVMVPSNVSGSQILVLSIFSQIIDFFYRNHEEFLMANLLLK